MEAPIPPTKIDPTQISSTPAGWIYVAKLEELMAHVRSMLETLSSRLPTLKERERQRLVGAIGTGLRALIGEIRALAANRGKLKEFNAEISAVVPVLDEKERSDYFKGVVAGTFSIIEVVRRWMETLGLVIPLTEAMGAEAVDEVWEAVLEEQRVQVEREFRKRGIAAENVEQIVISKSLYKVPMAPTEEPNAG